MSKIMIVDDDPNIRELVSVLLKNDGYDVCEAKDGRDALQRITLENPEGAIIDLMMANMDGYELCKKLRMYYENMPILMLTAKSDLISKVKGFEADELLMRVKALLRRYKIESSQKVSVGYVIIDRSSYSVIINGKKEDIPMKEFELLFKLAGFPGRTFTRDTLIEDIWGYDFDGNERTLDVHISRLRERFSEEVSGFKISTVRGLGYRLEVIA